VRQNGGLEFGRAGSPPIGLHLVWRGSILGSLRRRPSPPEWAEVRPARESVRIPSGVAERRVPQAGAVSGKPKCRRFPAESVGCALAGPLHADRTSDSPVGAPAG
jgi:hypothetical protein